MTMMVQGTTFFSTNNKMSGIVSTVTGAFAPSITTGFFFATAIAWVDVIRAVIAQLALS